MWQSLIRADCIQKGLINPQTRVTEDVQVYDLTGNSITTLGSSEFKDLDFREIQYLILSRNLIYHIDKEAFNGLGKLKTVNLTKNRISHLDPDTFVKNPSLVELYLRDNPIVIPKGSVLLSSTSLQLLDFSFCRQYSLSSTIFSQLPNLLTLNVSGNYLRSVQVETFISLSKLQRINFSQNPLLCDDSVTKLEEFLQTHNVSYTSFCGKKANTVLATMTPDPNEEIETVDGNDDTELIKQDIRSQVDVVLGNTLEDGTDIEKKSSKYELPMLWSLLVGFQVGVFVSVSVVFGWIWCRSNHERIVCSRCRRTTRCRDGHHLLENYTGTELETLHFP